MIILKRLQNTLSSWKLLRKSNLESMLLLTRRMMTVSDAFLWNLSATWNEILIQICEKTQKTLASKSMGFFFFVWSFLPLSRVDTSPYLRVPAVCARACVLMKDWNLEHEHLESSHICSFTSEIFSPHLVIQLWTQVISSFLPEFAYHWCGRIIV